MVGFGQSETANPFASGEFGQVFLALGLRAIVMDRVHHQRALHAHGTAVAAVHPLDLSGDQAIDDVVQPGAAVTFDAGAQKAHAAEFIHDFTVELLMASRHQHAGLELVLTELVGGIDDSALVVAELLRQHERVLPIETCFHGEISWIEKCEFKCEFECRGIARYRRSPAFRWVAADGTWLGCG